MFVFNSPSTRVNFRVQRVSQHLDARRFCAVVACAPSSESNAADEC